MAETMFPFLSFAFPEEVLSVITVLPVVLGLLGCSVPELHVTGIKRQMLLI